MDGLIESVSSGALSTHLGQWRPLMFSKVYHIFNLKIIKEKGKKNE